MTFIQIVKRFTQLFVDWIFLIAYLLFLFTATQADWNLDPIHDMFFARINSFLYYNTHAASLVAVCAAGAVILLLFNEEGITRSLLGVATIGGIHEYWFGFAYGTIFDPANIRYFITWGVIIGIAYALASPRQRWGMFLVFAVAGYYEISAAILGIPVTQTTTFNLTAAATQLLPNVVEVIGWIAVSAAYVFGVWDHEMVS